MSIVAVQMRAVKGSPCPLWIKSGHVRCKTECAEGQKRTSRHLLNHLVGASEQQWWHSQAGSKTDTVALFDHLVGDGEHACRNGEAELLSRRSVDNELEFGRLQHRQVGGLSALEDGTGIEADLMKHVREVGSIAHQPAGCHMVADRINRRNPVVRRQGGKLHSAADEKCVASDEEGIGMLARKSSKGRMDLADRTGVEDLDLQPEGGRRFLYLTQRGFGG